LGANGRSCEALATLDRILEILDTFADAFAHLGEPFPAEQEKNDYANDQKFWYA
jgi:hypothetical protein